MDPVLDLETDLGLALDPLSALILHLAVALEVLDLTLDLESVLGVVLDRKHLLLLHMLWQLRLHELTLQPLRLSQLFLGRVMHRHHLSVLTGLLAHQMVSIHIYYEVTFWL